MKDQMLLEKIPQIMASGIDSMKVEGRLKGVEYCAAVARAYRHAIDKTLEKRDAESTKIAFLREHGTGYYFEQNEKVFPQTPAQKGVLLGKIVIAKKDSVVVELVRGISVFDKATVIIRNG
jgi:putative protease